MYFLVYFGMYFFTRVFHACFSCGICVQYGGFPLMKHACDAAMPVAWPVLYCRRTRLFSQNSIACKASLVCFVKTNSCVNVECQHFP